MYPQSVITPSLQGQNLVQAMIHVLVVDNDMNESHVVPMLEHLCSYQVAKVKSASIALSMIAKAPIYTYDVVVVNINAFDWCGVAFLQRAEAIRLPVIMLLDDDKAVVIVRALELGASLCLKKPLSMDHAENLWQFAYFHKLRNLRENPPQLSVDLGEVVNESRKVEEAVDQDSKNKTWTKWTPQLHEKFMDAVRVLGEGRCYPKNILDEMNEPGLTRMQVASHLQKCRDGTCHVFSRGRALKGSGPHNEDGTKRHGKMPRLSLGRQPPLPETSTTTTTTTPPARVEKFEGINPSASFTDNFFDFMGLGLASTSTSQPAEDSNKMVGNEWEGGECIKVKSEIV